jgi:hypothetical protein
MKGSSIWPPFFVAVQSWWVVITDLKDMADCYEERTLKCFQRFGKF